jgi:IrrE N-terminal-like domain
MSLRRGFKAESNRISLWLRQELDLAPTAPIDLHAVAKRIGLVIVPLSEFRTECPSAVDQLTVVDPSAWSAGLIPVGPSEKILLHNDAHSPVRQRSNIAHEIAHVLSNHPLTLPLDNSGCRVVDQGVEEEANWLGGVILIPDAAAVYIVRAALTTQEACHQYGVSADLLRMRINLSGARKRVHRFYH